MDAHLLTRFCSCKCKVVLLHAIWCFIDGYGNEETCVSFYSYWCLHFASSSSKQIFTKAFCDFLFANLLVLEITSRKMLETCNSVALYYQAAKYTDIIF